jgi:hypothetical protein
MILNMAESRMEIVYNQDFLDDIKDKCFIKNDKIEEDKKITDKPPLRNRRIKTN